LLRPAVVLDAFALLALVRAEPGQAQVVARLNDAARGACRVLMSTINVGEVLYRLERERGEAAATALVSRLGQSPVELHEATWARVVAAAHLKAQYRVSYADAFAVALAQEFEAALMTGDPEMRALAGVITVEWLPRQ
jgi:ribonuclease VapC